MALVLADRVRETSTTTGTGTITLAGAVGGYQSFSVIGNANTTYYCIANQSASEWEVGIGTYTSAGTTLARTTVLASSNAGSAVNFSAGTKDVFVTYPAGYTVNTQTGAASSVANALTFNTSGGAAAGSTYNGSAARTIDYSTVGAQATLVSGTNIKTINSTSLLGSGNITVAASPGGSNTQVQYNSSGAFAGSANLTFDGTNLTCGGTVTANSDETLKTNWRGLPADFIEQLAKVKHGTYDRLDVELTQDGVSAQSLQPLMPNSVRQGEDGKLSVAYGNAALVAAIALAERVVQLEALVAKLTEGK